MENENLKLKQKKKNEEKNEKIMMRLIYLIACQDWNQIPNPKI